VKTSNSITTLPDSPEQDRSRRFHRYVWQMGVRVVLFVAAILIYTIWHTWLCVIPIVLAGVIPWVAVIIANAGNSRGHDQLVAPAGAIVLLDREQQDRDAAEDRRAQAYRDEQERLREEAHAAQEEWQRHGDRSRPWGHRTGGHR
jgi:hypothetical protein